MGKKEGTQLIVKNINLDDFREYLEKDLIEKLSQHGILFFHDKYSKGISIDKKYLY